MKRHYALLLVFCFALMLAVSVYPVRASGDLWVQRAPMPTSEAYFGAVSVNGQIYVVGHNFTYAYDSSADRWVSKAPMPSNRQAFATAACQDKIYVVGGWSSINPNTGIAVTVGTTEMYDPATNSWTTKASMPTSTADMEANVVNGKIYVISGIADISRPTLSNYNWVYDPASNSWNAAANISTAVFHYASAVVGNKIYVEGGDGVMNSVTTNLNQIYDPATNTWSNGQPLPTAIRHSGAGATTGTLASPKLYVIGGTNDGYHGVAATQIYDPQGDNWTLGALLPTARLGLAVAVLNDSLYALGGESWAGPENNFGTVYAVNEQYIPLDYQGPVPSPYVPTPSPTPTSTPNPTPTSTATLTPSENPTASPTASSQPTPPPEPFPTATVVTGVAVIAVGVGIVSFIYFKKRPTKQAKR